jgi:hypothetical protein
MDRHDRRRPPAIHMASQQGRDVEIRVPADAELAVRRPGIFCRDAKMPPSIF